MKYLLKWPDGPTYEYSLDELKRESAKGKLNKRCTVRRSDEKEWHSIGELLGVPSDTTLCFIVSGDQRQGPYVPAQIRSMWSNGAIIADAALIWDGAAGPIPVTTLIENPMFADYRIPERSTAVEANTAPSHLVTCVAAGIIAAFFMPWFQLFGAGVSAFELTKFGSYANYLWVIPGLAGVTMLMGVSGTNNRIMGAIAGIVPLVALVFGYFYIQDAQSSQARNGSGINVDLSGVAAHAMAIGFFLTVGLCILIIFCGLQNKQGEG